MFDLFISYSRSTYSAEAAKLQENLEKKGMKVFLDKQEIDPGANFPNHIAEALLNSKLALVFADESYFSKTWCVYEFQVCIAPYSESVKASAANDLLLENLLIALPAKGDLNTITAAFPPEIKSTNWPLIEQLDEVETAVKDRLKSITSSLSEKLKNCNNTAVVALREGALLPFVTKPVNIKSYTPIAPASVKEKFKGRSEKLWEVYNSLEVKSKDEAFRSCIIEGIAGMGKTQLAAEYMWRFAPYTYPDGFIWVSADTDEKGLLEQYSHIYEEFSDSNTVHFNNLQDAAASLKQFFKSQGAGKKILWVIDNFPETGKMSEIKQLSDYCPVKEYVSLLVTTRQHAAAGADKVITLDALTSDAAIQYLTQEPVERKWLAEEDWYRIVNWVGNLPLALRILYIDLADGFINPKELLTKAISSESSVVVNEEANALKEEMPPGYIKSIHDALAVSYERLTKDEELFSAAHLFSRLAARPVMDSFLLPFITTKQLAKLAKRGWLQPVQETNKFQRCWTMHKIIGSFLRNKSLEPVEENIALLNWLGNFFTEHFTEDVHEAEPHFRMITLRALEALKSTGNEELRKTLEETCLKAATAGFHGDDLSRGMKYLAADILHRMGSADLLVEQYQKNVDQAEEKVVTTMIHALSACYSNMAAVNFVLNRLSDERDQVRWMAILYLPAFMFVDICIFFLDALMKETNENILANNELSFPQLLNIENEEVLKNFLNKTFNYYQSSTYAPHQKLIVRTWCELLKIKNKDFKAGNFTYHDISNILWQVANTNEHIEVRSKAMQGLAVTNNETIYPSLLEQLQTTTEEQEFKKNIQLLAAYITTLEKPGAPKVSIKEDEGSNYISGSLGPSGKSRKDLFTPIAALLFQPISASLQEIAIHELLQHNSGKLAIADLVNDKIEAKTDLDTCAEIAEKVIEMQPDFSSPYWWKALVLLEKKEYEAAYINLSQVITLSPTFASAYWYRGKLNEAFNNQEAAEMDLQNFNRLNV